MIVSPKCAFCGHAGKKGPKWILSWGGSVSRVHKPCGEKLFAHAPPNVVVKLRPSDELRAEWDKERSERDARSFWEEAFAKAREKAKVKASP